MSRLALACCLALLLADAASAQYRRPTRRGDVHRMDIYNGTTHTVRYFGFDLTPSESSTLRDLERLENELEFSRNLTSLKQQYVAGERALDAYRRSVQFSLYGQDITETTYGNVALMGYGRRGWLPGYGYGYTNVGPVSAAFAGYDRTRNLSLANGMGYEGTVKDAVAKIVATQATPEYFAALERSYDRMALRASASDALRVALNFPEPEEAKRERSRIRALAGEADGRPVTLTLTLRSGEKLGGRKLTEKGDWMVLEMAGGGQVRIRASEVVRIDEVPVGGGIKGAID